MGDPGFVPGLIGAAISELLRATILEVKRAAKHAKYFKELTEMLHSLEAFVGDVEGSNSSFVVLWLKRLEAFLAETRVLVSEYQSFDGHFSKHFRFTMSNKILRLMQKMKGLSDDAAMASYAQVHSLRRDLQKHLDKQQEDTTYLLVAVTAFQCTQSESYSTDAARNEINKATRSLQSQAGSSQADDRLQAGSEGLLVPEFQQVPDKVFGMEEMASRLEQALLDQSSSKWIGVWGKGGAGKTLLSQTANNSRLVQAHFEGRVYWLTVGQDPDIARLLMNLSRKMPGCPSVLPGEGYESGKNKIYNYTRGKKTLVILDDVWDGTILEQLDVVEASNKSKVLVTTRKNEMFHRLVQCTVLEVAMLSPEESWNLFCWHAFGGDEPDLKPGLEEVASKVASECKGLPLALKVIGSSMAWTLDIGQWKLALTKLANAGVLDQDHEEQVVKRLKLSYDELTKVDAVRGQKLQAAFIYFAAFKEDEKVQVDVLIKYWTGEGMIQFEDDDEDAEVEGYYILGQLIGRSLIDLDIGWSDALSTKFLTCKIHDVLRDMAFYILEDNQQLEQQTCLFRAGKRLNEVPESWHKKSGAGRMNAERISLTGNYLEHLSVPLRTPALKVLLLNENQSLAKINPVFLRSVRNLIVLDLGRTAIAELPDEVSKLANLTVLELSYCSKLTIIPASIGKLTKLEHLGMQGCGFLRVFPLDKLSNLVNLRYLNTRGAANIWNQDLTASHSQSFSFCFTGSHQQGVENLSSLTKLTKLWITGNKQEITPLSKLTRLRHLSFSLNPALKSLPDELQSLERLQILDLNTCGLERLPHWLPDRFSRLQTLDLRCCQLLELPAGLERLKELTKLDLSICQRLNRVPEAWKDPDAFPCLAELWMTGCRSIIRLPELAMKRLLLFNLVDCSSLGRVPDSIKVVTTLEVLSLKGCVGVEEIPQEAMVSLRNLKELILSGTKISSLPTSLGYLPQLRKLMISSCKKLESLPGEWETTKEVEFQGKDLFPALEEISLSNSGIEKVASGIAIAPKLRKIDVSGCRQSVYVPELVELLQSRKLVHIVGWPIF